MAHRAVQYGAVAHRAVAHIRRFELRRARVAARVAGLIGIATGAALLALLAGCSTSASGGGTEDVVSQVRLRDGERFVYRLVDRDGELVGRGTFTTTRAGGAFELRQSYEDLAAPAGERAVADHSLVVVEAATLRPRTMERTIEARDEEDDERVVAEYTIDDEDRPVVRVVRTTGGDERTRELRLRDHYYEDQSSLWLWRTLEFGEDLDVRYTAVDPREASQVTASLVQVDRQLRETPAGTFDTWVIQIRTGRETVNVWVHVQPPHEVVRFDNGRLFFELESAELVGR